MASLISFTTGAVCFSKLNRLKSVLFEVRTAIELDLKADLQQIEFLESVKKRLENVNNVGRNIKARQANSPSKLNYFLYQDRKHQESIPDKLSSRISKTELSSRFLKKRFSLGIEKKQKTLFHTPRVSYYEAFKEAVHPRNKSKDTQKLPKNHQSSRLGSITPLQEVDSSTPGNKDPHIVLNGEKFTKSNPFRRRSTVYDNDTSDSKKKISHVSKAGFKPGEKQIHSHNLQFDLSSKNLKKLSNLLSLIKTPLETANDQERLRFHPINFIYERDTEDPTQDRAGEKGHNFEYYEVIPNTQKKNYVSMLTPTESPIMQRRDAAQEANELKDDFSRLASKN